MFRCSSYNSAIKIVRKRIIILEKKGSYDISPYKNGAKVNKKYYCYNTFI